VKFKKAKVKEPTYRSVHSCRATQGHAMNVSPSDSVPRANRLFRLDRKMRDLSVSPEAHTLPVLIPVSRIAGQTF